MANGGGWTAGKVILLVAGILVGLGILCCGGLWFLAGDKIKAGITFGTNSAQFVERLQKDFGGNSIFGIEQNDSAQFILTIGVEGELTPERASEVQDGAWKALGEVYGQDGFLPVKHVAVGKPLMSDGKSQGKVVGWSAHMVPVEELVARTGVPAPPTVKFLPENFQGGPVHIEVKGGSRDEKEDGGGGAGGK